MSIVPFRLPPDTFVKHDAVKLAAAEGIANREDGVVPELKLKQNCKRSAARETRPNLLRDDHIVLLAIDALLALHASFKKWRSRRRTLRALADLDERQLHDIGLTRDEGLHGYGSISWSLGRRECYRALSELDDSEINNLSEFGRQVWREARRATHHRGE